MELVKYLNYHYFNENPKWVQDAMGMTPKYLNDILADLFVKLCILFVFFLIICLAVRACLSLGRIHDEKLFQLYELKQHYRYYVNVARRKQEVANRNESNNAEGDGPARDQGDQPRQEE